MKKYLLLTFVLFVFFTSNVYAKENIYFTNSSGVEMTELEFNNIKAIHGEEFLNSMNLETFNKYYEFYSCQNLEIEKVESIDFNNKIIPFSDTHSTESKVLSITSAYTPFDKMITINLDWKKAPKIRSYDVFGFRTENVSFTDISVNNNFCGSNTKPSNTKLTNIGYGASIKLPTSCDQISMQILFKTTSSGKVYASYQHAVKNISLNDSMNYTFSYNGLGNVFLFNNSSLFDKMGGVEKSI